LSTHRVEVFEITELEKHPNADSLSIAYCAGYQVVVRTADWRLGALGAYVPPDSLVPVDRPEFSFLDAGRGRTYERVRVAKLRGELSMGLLVPAPEGSLPGDNVAEALGVVPYVSKQEQKEMFGGESVAPPPGIWLKYDLENFHRYADDIFYEGEEIIATEKIHGANAKFTATYELPEDGVEPSELPWRTDFTRWATKTLPDDTGAREVRFLEGYAKLHAGSRTLWKEYSPKNLWWRALSQDERLIQLLANFPDIAVYGEVFGAVQDLRYGFDPGAVTFRAFDILKNGRWMDYDAARDLADAFGVAWVPVVYRGPFDKKLLTELAEGPSCIDGADHIRDGIVVRPKRERTHVRCGRVKLKLVSNAYLMRKEANYV
jgi:RNA ligase (TIGR02306 family)